MAWGPIAWHRPAGRARSLGRDGGQGGPCIEMTQPQYTYQQQQNKQQRQPEAWQLKTCVTMTVFVTSIQPQRERTRGTLFT